MAIAGQYKPPAKGRKIDDLIKILMVVSLIIMVSGTILIVVPPQPNLPIFDPLPPADVQPSQEPFWESFDNISISTRINCYVWDTHQIDRFDVNLIIRVNNTGPTSFWDFHPVKLSIFRDDHWHYYTFGLIPSTNTTIEAFSNITLYYDGDRTLNTIEGITPEQGSIVAYGRVLISYEDQEIIVTSSLFEDFFPIE